MLKQKPHWYFEGSTILPLGEQWFICHVKQKSYNFVYMKNLLCFCFCFCFCFFFYQIGPSFLVGNCRVSLWRVWRYQKGNQDPYIEEEQTTQWPKENVQKEKKRSTKHTYKTKDQVTRTPVKTRGAFLVFFL